MARRNLLCCAAFLLVGATATAQTIQLPSFSSFGVDTTVVVPDSGGAYAARDRRASYGTSTFGGVPLNRGWGVRRQIGGLGVTASVHDPAAADAALRGALVRRAQHSGGKSPPLAIHAGRANHDAPLGSVAEMAQRRTAAAAAANREAQATFEKGLQAQAAGKASVAAIYFRAAAAQANGPLLAKIRAELAAPADRASSR
ncbi:MAG: hypothetical protein AB7O59_16425 [Pirellulales bacterium]